MEISFGAATNDWSAWIQAAATSIALAIAIWQMLEARAREARQRYATSRAAYSLARTAHQTLVPIISDLRAATVEDRPYVARRAIAQGRMASVIQSLISFDASRLPSEMLVSRFLLSTSNAIAFQHAVQDLAEGRPSAVGPTYEELFVLVQRASNDMVEPLMRQNPGYNRVRLRESILRPYRAATRLLGRRGEEAG